MTLHDGVPDFQALKICFKSTVVIVHRKQHTAQAELSTWKLLASDQRKRQEALGLYAATPSTMKGELTSPFQRLYLHRILTLLALPLRVSILPLHAFQASSEPVLGSMASMHVLLLFY